MFNFKNYKKMNLENLNLVELNAQEAQEVEGGIWPIIIAVAGYFCLESVTNPIGSNTSFTNGFKDGYNN
jgi:lactobin A/cerein 7B family class IIb bacteriocin